MLHRVSISGSVDKEDFETDRHLETLQEPTYGTQLPDFIRASHHKLTTGCKINIRRLR